MAKKRVTKAKARKATKATRAKAPRKRKEPRTAKAPKPKPEVRLATKPPRGGMRIKSIARLPGSRAAVTTRRGPRTAVARGLQRALGARRKAAAPAKVAKGPRGVRREKAARKEAKAKDK